LHERKCDAKAMATLRSFATRVGFLELRPVIGQVHSVGAGTLANRHSQLWLHAECQILLFALLNEYLAADATDIFSPKFNDTLNGSTQAQRTTWLR